LPEGGSVIGVGTDLIEVDRIEKSCSRYMERFLDRIFTKEEQEYCLKMKNPYPHLAARFAAKEAVSKAFSTGIGAELDWTSIGVIKGDRGQPAIQFDTKGKALLKEVGGDDVLVSLSHTKTLAQAFAVLIRVNPKLR
jgi:holo-[acyl-carrier protein] synthase